MSDKIAIIKTGGKQYKVKPGDKIKVEKLDAKAGESVKFETLLTSSSDAKDVQIGTPDLDNKVEAKVLEQGRDKKTTVTKYKNKTRYKRTIGHRQPFTQVEITEIK